jgi:hypothetical protein
MDPGRTARIGTAVVKAGGPVSVMMAGILVAGVLVSGCAGRADSAPAEVFPTGQAASASGPQTGGVPDPGAVLGPMPTTGAGPAERDLAATLESCKLLTKGDLEQALGQQYRDAEPTLDADSSVISSVTKVNRGCTYWAAERRATGVGEVDIDVAHMPDATATYATVRDRYRNVPTFADVPGVGEAAFRSGGMLMIRKDNTILELGVNMTTDQIAQARLVTIARIILPRV